jgi:hypothetical protein
MIILWSLNQTRSKVPFKEFEGDYDIDELWLMRIKFISEVLIKIKKRSACFSLSGINFNCYPCF